MKLITISIILLLLLVVGCQSKADDNYDSFDKYCNTYCTMRGMTKTDDTKEEAHTFNCVCETVFLKVDWLKENKVI